MIPTGRITGLILLVVLCAIIIANIYRAKRGKGPQLRKLAAIDAIEEVIGRAVETGRPVHVCTGEIASLYKGETDQVIAGISVLAYTARLTARLGAKLVVTQSEPDVYLVERELVREMYIAEGRGDSFNDDMVIPLLGGPRSMKAGLLGVVERLRPAANISIGPWYSTTVYMMEAFHGVGAMQITGTARISQIPFIAAASDYFTIGEEVYCVGAYLSDDPSQKGAIVGIDYGKILFITLILIGLISVIFNANVWLINLLKT